MPDQIDLTHPRVQEGEVTEAEPQTPQRPTSVTERTRRFVTVVGPLVRPLWRALDRTAAGVGLVAETIALASLGLGVGLQLWDLAARNIEPHHAAPLWVSDASTLSFITGAFLYVARTRIHIGFSGIARMLHRDGLAHRVDLVTRPVVAACLFLLAWEGVQLVRQTIPLGGRYSPEFFVPLWAFYAIVPLTLTVAGLSWLVRGGLTVDEASDEVLSTTAARTGTNIKTGRG